MQETKYGTVPPDEILKVGMDVHDFERMCVVYESIVAMVCHFYFRYILMYIISYSNFHYSHQCIYTHYSLFLCLQMEGEEEENNQHHEQNIPQNNPSHGSSLSSDSS